MDNIIRISLVSLLVLLVLGAGSSFYIKDDQHQFVFWPGQSLVFPNISGADGGDIEIVLDHADLLNKGTNTHSQIDTHIGTSSIHFTEASIDHSNILNHGTNTHSQIDTHLGDASIHFSAEPFNNHTSNSSIHFTEASIDHANILNHGTNTHAQLDSHVSDSTIHFPIYDNVSSVFDDKVWSSEFSKYYTDNFGGGGGTSLTVTDDTTTVYPADKITFDPTGFVVTDEGTGDVLVQNLGGTGGGDVLDTDTTCYVATTGSDTQPCGDSGDACATPNGCLTRYAGHKINSDIYLTIELADGTYSLSSSITLTHPNGDRIKITGQNTYTKSLTSIQSTSGSSGAYSLVLNLDSVTNITTDDYVLIFGCSGGTNPTYTEGFLAVTNVDSGNSRITVTSKHKTGAPSGAVTGTVKIIKSILSISTENDLLVLVGTKLGQLKDLGLLPYASKTGIYLENLASLIAIDSAGVNGGSYGLAAYTNSTFISNYLLCTGQTYGIFIQTGSSALLNNTVISGATSVGLANTTGTQLQSWYGSLTGNTTGIDTYSNSFARISMSVTGNTTGLSARDVSMVLATGSTLANNSTSSTPSNGTEGNRSSYAVY